MGIMKRSLLAGAAALPLMATGAGLASAQEAAVSTETISYSSGNDRGWGDDHYYDDDNGLLGDLLDSLFGDYHDDDNDNHHGDYDDDGLLGLGLL